MTDRRHAPHFTPPTGEPVEPPDDECRPRAALEAQQAERLAALLRHLRGRNAFYDRKLAAAGVDVDRVALPADLTALPFTSKAELAVDQAASPPWGTALTEPLHRYTRYNQTSSTTGRPLRWIDTPETWQWMLDCWKAVYRAAGVTARDRVFFPFSFGPFLGFWTGFDAAVQIGAHAIPAGGMTSTQRLALIDALAPTVICCTPTYALRLLDAAGEPGGSPTPAGGAVRVIVVAGEPGGSIPATRERIERGWGARVIDHHGLTEVGPISFECLEAPGFLHVNEREFIAEVVDPDTGAPVADGTRGELVITNLGRTASPVIRYRTRDLVIRTRERCACGRTLARLAGGVVARADDMVNVRGVNVYPAAVEAVLRGIDAVAEYRCTVGAAGALRAIGVEVEVAPGAEPAAVATVAANRLRDALGLSARVTPVSAGVLPRFEMKARRFVIDRGAPPVDPSGAREDPVLDEEPDLCPSRPFGRPGRPVTVRFRPDRPGGPMTITGIANIMLGATDLDRSRAFYRDRLGLSIKQEIPGFVFFDAGPVTLCLSAAHARLAEKPGPTEVVLAVASVREAYAALEADGVEFLREPANVTGDSWAANFRDPDGHLLSIFGPE